jgi:hypothetical protein
MPADGSGTGADALPAPAMLGAMDIAAAEAPVAPWIAVGVMLTLAAQLLVGMVVALVVRRRAAGPSAEPPPEDHDDLPGFFESPPGSTATGVPASTGFVALMAPPPAPVAAPPRRTTGPVLAAVLGVAVLLLVLAAVVAGTTGTAPDRDDRAERSRAEPRPAGIEARMRFAGVVLQQHAVGVTVAFAEVELASDRDGAVARLTLPTWNCLAPEAPDDPAAAGCVPARTEYAELRSPALDVTRTDDGMRFSGDFPSSTRPTGGAPEPTGRAYRIEVWATADRELPAGDWSPVGGILLVEDRATTSVDGEMRVDL